MYNITCTICETFIGLAACDPNEVYCASCAEQHEDLMGEPIETIHINPEDLMGIPYVDEKELEDLDADDQRIINNYRADNDMPGGFVGQGEQADDRPEGADWFDHLLGHARAQNNDSADPRPWIQNIIDKVKAKANG